MLKLYDSCQQLSTIININDISKLQGTAYNR